MIETTIADGCVKVECDGKTIARCESETDAERIKHALESESLKFVVFAARDEQDKAIEDVLDFADIHFAATGGTRTDTLVAVLADWKQRVQSEHQAKITESEDTRKRMHLRLDEKDFLHILAAVERRKAWDCEPDDSDSCEIGGMIAEICRGWMELIEHDTQPKPRRTDNGDGTVTFSGIDVTVREEVLGGRDVLAVRVPKSGERYIDSFGNAFTCCGNQANRLRVIIGQQTQPPAPLFREGGFYRRRNGQVAGPLERRNNSNDYVWLCRGMSYTAFGVLFVDKASPFDLIPGEVIVWRHPTSMPADVWSWSGESMQKGDEPYIWRKDAIARVWADWTDPPRVGKWKVVDGQEYATWEGE